jgi:hypothetical protein
MDDSSMSRSMSLVRTRTMRPGRRTARRLPFEIHRLTESSLTFSRRAVSDIVRSLAESSVGCFTAQLLSRALRHREDAGTCWSRRYGRRWNEKKVGRGFRRSYIAPASPVVSTSRY